MSLKSSPLPHFSLGLVVAWLCKQKSGIDVLLGLGGRQRAQKSPERVFKRRKQTQKGDYPIIITIRLSVVLLCRIHYRWLQLRRKIPSRPMNVFGWSDSVGLSRYDLRFLCVGEEEADPMSQLMIMWSAFCRKSFAASQIEIHLLMLWFLSSRNFFLLLGCCLTEAVGGFAWNGNSKKSKAASKVCLRRSRDFAAAREVAFRNF